MKLLLLLPVAVIGIIFIAKQKESAEMPTKRYAALPVFCSPSFDPAKASEGNAPLFNGLGNLTYPITTKSERAQQFFNQGLTLIYAFNHGEAARSFNEAVRLDSTCAMAYWGLGMVLGPNYNAALDPSSLNDINDAMANATKNAAAATEKEQDLIKALVRRYPNVETNDMAPYHSAYAEEMKNLHLKYPDDIDIMVLFADALMNEHPWDLWLKNGEPRPWTPAIQQLLELCLMKSHDHPGANHYYIHLMEASKSAHRALPSADILRDLLPSAGHLVHMPSHIYIRTGFYHKGVIANEKASVADSTYIAQCKVEGTYPLLYYPHNIHFLAACAFLEGSSAKAIEAAWGVSRNANKKYLYESPTVQHYYIIPYYTLVHLAKWDDILKIPIPGKSLKYPRAIWHYSRGMALNARGDVAGAEHQLSVLKTYVNDESLKSLRIWDMNSVAEPVSIAANMLEAEIAAGKKQYRKAIELLRTSVEIEAGLSYTEPPDWFFSVRHTLGHVLLQAKDYAEAEAVYLEDLAVFPENGWSLMGLYNSLIHQGKAPEAKEVLLRFNKAWQWADIKITSSRMY